ncbi:hypothetical protein B0H11DRAFT_1798718 [Mycena galericulata]|nr:hypothetical protein B0H11DRAFT_1798718 [Mycena galericulata]
MKRGFLNSSKAKARPLGPSLDTAPEHILGQYKRGTEFAKLPIGKQSVEVPEVPKGYNQVQFKEMDPSKGSHPNAMTVTRVPNNLEPDEPTTECFFFPGSKEVLMNLDGFPQPLVHPETPAFRMSEMPGKGEGLVSTRALRAGDLILTERPLLVAARGAPVSWPPGFTREQYMQHGLNEMEMQLEMCIKRMRPEYRAAFMALKNSHTEDGSGPIVGRVRTNGLSLDGLRPGVEDETKSYSAICKEISRLNHSCSPNTQPCFDIPSFSYQLFAVRDIAAGEELTFQYIDVQCSTAARNEELKPYDFVCTCTACTDPESDARRAAIKAVAPSVLTWIFNPTFQKDRIMDECREQLALIAREGLEHLHVYYALTHVMMEMHISLGDAQTASEWAAKLDKCRWEEKPADVKTLLDPASPAYQAHPFWRKKLDGTRPTKKDPVKMAQEMMALAAKDPHGGRPWSLMLF